jgi:hypothetical protein
VLLRACKEKRMSLFDFNWDKATKSLAEQQKEWEEVQKKRREEDDRLSCTITMRVDILRHSLDDKVEVAKLTGTYYGSHRWSWEEIESNLLMSRWMKDTKGFWVNMEVAGVKIVSIVKDIEDLENNTRWTEEVKESE